MKGKSSEPLSLIPSLLNENIALFEFVYVDLYDVLSLFLRGSALHMCSFDSKILKDEWCFVLISCRDEHYVGVFWALGLFLRVGWFPYRKSTSPL